MVAHCELTNQRNVQNLDVRHTDKPIKMFVSGRSLPPFPIPLERPDIEINQHNKNMQIVQLNYRVLLLFRFPENLLLHNQRRLPEPEVFFYLKKIIVSQKVEDRSLFEVVSTTNIMRLFSQKRLQGFPFLYLIVNSGYAVYEHPVSKPF